MNVQEMKRRAYTLCVAGMNVLVQMGVVGYVWYLYYNPIIRIPFWTKGHWYILTLYGLVLLFFTHIYGGLKIGYLKKEDALFSQIFATLCTNLVFYAEICLLAYHFPTPVPLLWVTVVDIIFIVIWLYITVCFYNRLFPPHHVLLVYGIGTEAAARAKLGERKDKFHVYRAVGTDDMEKIQEIVGIYDAVVLWDVPDPMRNKILKECYGKRIRIYSLPSISDVIISGAEVMHFFDVPLYLLRSNPLTVDQLIIKRIIDLVLAMLVMAIVWPFMLITAICVKIYDRGPVLYKQVRSTIYGKKFVIYKFRSMVTNAEEDGIARLASRHDDRITPIGRIIRKVRLDELPQLFNIIKGDMSFVGPRPERPEIIMEYVKELPEFAYRMNVKAGLTGYAQIYGKYNTLPYDKLKLDLYYIEHYSLWLDLKLLILTAKIVFSMESAEGVKDAD